MSIVDLEQRLWVLDPEQSFLVQAPAGSGKTSLLTQRLLKLLTVVDEPEQIIALTFTQKAAQEMRHRVIQALSLTPDSAAQTEYNRALFDLAQTVKQRDQERQWGLCEQPARLRVMTIDAFCVMINQMLPLHSKMGGLPGLTDYPTPFYRQAVYQLLDDLGQDLPWAAALERTLAHLDNRVDSFVQLLTQMCGIREQWLGLVMSTQAEALASMLEQSLLSLHQAHAAAVQEIFPAQDHADLLEVVNFALGHLGTHEHFNSADLFGSTTVIQAWKKICPLLLTQNLNFRKTVNKSQGFPAASDPGLSATHKDQRVQMKAKMLSILDALSQTPKAERLFAKINALPELSSTQVTELTASVLTLLPVLTAYCQLQFQHSGQIDFIEMSLRALQSLNVGEDGVSDLSLLLDYKIQHILVDEFQDTSRAQLNLLTALTQGFEPGDGRTLFCVGDPMQSIYRFRKAEVGLFAEVKERGIGSIPLTFIELRSNFRSSAILVNSVNHCFKAQAEKMEGQLCYFEAIASGEDSLKASSIRLLTTQDPDQEAKNIVRCIRAWQQESPEHRIAILVRAKRHAVKILEQLKNAQIQYQATDLEGLVDKPYIQDLLSLTLALSHESDHLAWYAVLHSPMIGFSLTDLLSCAELLKQEGCLIQVLESEPINSILSLSGQKILRRVRPILKRALQLRTTHALPWIVEYTWQAMGGPLVLQTESDLKDVSIFLQGLNQLLARESCLTRALLEEAFSVYSASEREMDSKAVVVMTIHKSKGLEFDRVIIPACERRVRQTDKPLLLYEEVQAEGAGVALLAVLPREGKSSVQERALYQYLLSTEQAKQADEIVRLLYVASTRAKSHLLYSAVQDTEILSGSPGSFLALLTPGIQAGWLSLCQPEFDAHVMQAEEKSLTYAALPPVFPYALKSVAELLTGQNDDLNRPERSGESHEAVAMGVVLHEILFMMAGTPLGLWSEAQLLKLRPKIKSRLRAEGMGSTEIESAATRVTQAVLNMLNHPIGRFILSQDHQEAAAEFGLVSSISGQAKLSVVDRFFIHDDCLWLIDYKMTEPSAGETLEQFFVRLKERYQTQLNHYQACLAAYRPGIKTFKKVLCLPLISEFLIE